MPIRAQAGLLFFLQLVTFAASLYGQDLEYEVQKGDSVDIDTCGTYCRLIRVGFFPEVGGFNVGTRIQTDTCGTLAGQRLKCVWKEVTALEGHGGSCERRFTVYSESIQKRNSTQDTIRNPLVSWFTNQSNHFEFPSCPDPEFVAQEKDLKVFDPESVNHPLMAHFKWRQGRLQLAPEFRKRLVSALVKPDTTLGRLVFLNEWMDWEAVDKDPILSQVLELHAIRDSMMSGKIDEAIEALRLLRNDSNDAVTSRITRHWLDSLQTWKQAHQPLVLEGVQKIGRLIAEPVYPPLDSPTVFWRDSLLCVVQQDGKSIPSLRTWNPHTGAWGKLEKARFPETGIREMYGLYCEETSSWLDPQRNCWTHRLPDPGSLACPAWECSPLVSLADTIPGSPGNPNHLARAGGSSAAGYGRFEFGKDGLLYLKGKPGLTWKVLPDSLPPVFGQKSYDNIPDRDYPVVVSPDQLWVAFALHSQDGKSIQLWVGRIRYREQESLGWGSEE